MKEYELKEINKMDKKNNNSGWHNLSSGVLNMKSKLNVAKAEPLYKVINNEKDEYVIIDLMDQGGFIQIKFDADAVIIDGWAEKKDGSDNCIGSMAFSYQELWGGE